MSSRGLRRERRKLQIWERRSQHVDLYIGFGVPKVHYSNGIRLVLDQDLYW
jgi:hypothetical protein